MKANKSIELFYEEYVSINNIQQYFLHYPKECDNVVLFVHGGMTEAQLTYRTVLYDRLYSFVYYDQRGTGKTQSKNKSLPEEITLDVLVKDLDATIQYIRQKYPNKKLILLGHSRGSVLAVEYLKTHSDTVDVYIGMGQIVCFKEGMEYTFDHIQPKANKQDHAKIDSIRNLVEAASLENLAKASIDLEKLQNKYGLAGYRYGNLQLLRLIMKSPVFNISDFLPLLTAIKTNRNLFPCVGGCCLHTWSTFPFPLYFLCGRNDWQAPGVLVEKYYEHITAPRKQLYWIENAGHFTDLDNPEACMNAINEILCTFLY